MEVVLFMLMKDGGQRAFPLAKATVVLGRREDCDFRIPLADVSRQHCRVVIDSVNETVTVEDLGSANGTLVNGKRVRSQALAAGDVLEVGPVRFVVQVDGRPPDESVRDAAESRPTYPKLARGTSVDDMIDDVLSGEPEASSDDSDIFLPEPDKR
jgi:pSer/pThr/pTyr-binding forkhead associated (FHA) protein